MPHELPDPIERARVLRCRDEENARIVAAEIRNCLTPMVAFLEFDDVIDGGVERERAYVRVHIDRLLALADAIGGPAVPR